jgi:TetR/AcrR family transcriptional regulator, mexCD-oprJ operon repressor
VDLASETSPEEPEGRRRRSDARRNIESIVDAALVRLADHPEASMQEIAEAAGVHRATVHRHFATRGELLRAVRVRALDEFQAVLADPELAALPAGAALERLTRRSLELGDRRRLYRVVPSFDDLTDTRGDALRAPVGALLARAQDAGLVRRDVPPTMLAAAWAGLVLIALPLIGGGELDLDAAERFVLTLLGSG